MAPRVDAAAALDDRLRLEHELREAAQRYAELIEHAPVGVFRSTQDGRLLMANPALAGILGYDSPADLLTLDLARDVYRHAEERAALVARYAKSPEPWSFEVEWRRRDGTPIWVLLSARGVRDEAAAFLYFEAFVQDVTERRRAQMRLAESEERLRTIVETEPECVKLVDRAGRLLTMNPAGLAMIEAESLEQVAGMDVAALIAPEHRAAFDELNRRVFQGESATLEFDVVGLRGTRRRLETHAVPLRGGAGGEVTAHLAVTRDVTERRRAEDRFQRVFETAAMGIAIVAPDLRYVELNPALSHYLGYEPRELVGRTFLEVTHPDDLAMDRDLAQQVFRGEIPHYRIEKRFVRRDGQVVWGLLTATAIRDPAGTPLYGVGMVEDITERKRAAEALARSGAQLRRLAARLEAIREEERTRIARDIHDQFGQTLTALKMDLAWLRRRLPPRSTAQTRKIREMSEVIDAAVVATQRLAAELRPGVLDDLGLLAAVRWLADEFRKHSEIACVVSVPPDELPLKRDQAIAVFRILQEALTNVARHAGARRVEIALHRLPDALELVVSDDGRGIGPQELDDPRALGIVGIRERALSWGGTVAIHGIPGHGTTVRLFMPVQR